VAASLGIDLSFELSLLPVQPIDLVRGMASSLRQEKLEWHWNYLVRFGCLAPPKSGCIQMPTTRDYLRVKEAAVLLGVCPNTIRAWGGEGKIPEYRHPINGFRLYKRSELEGVLRRIEQSKAKGSRVNR
jgi:DNA (cytosine-5)-methyltransferase 1